MVRMPAFGLDGPWRDRPGFAQTMEQVTGLAWLTGHVDDQPRIQRGPCDPNGGMHAVVRRAGRARACATAPASGSLVEAPMFEAALNIAAEPIIEWTAYGNLLVARRQPQPVGRAAGRVRDRRRPSGGWRSSVATDEQWAALRRRARPSRPGPTDPALATHAGRRAAHDVLDDDARRVGGRRRPRRGRRRCSSAPGCRRRPRSTTRAARRSTRSSWPAATTRTSTTRSSAMHAHPSLPFRFAGVDRWIRTPGADCSASTTDEILTDCSACSDDEIAALEADGVDRHRPAGL